MDQRRVVLAVILSVAVVVLYNELVIRPRQRPTSPPTHAAPAESPAEPTPQIPRAAAQPEALADGAAGKLSCNPDDPHPIVVETDVWRATITHQGGRLVSLALKKFRKTVRPDSPPLELVEQHADLLPLTLRLGTDDSDAAVGYGASTATLTLSGDETGDVVLSGKTPDGRELQKHLRFRGNAYLFDVDVRVSGGTPPSEIGLLVPRLEREGLEGSGRNARDVALILSQGKLTETLLDPDPKVTVKPTRLDDASWVGFSVPFFLGAIVAPDPGGGIASVEPLGSRSVVELDRAPNGSSTAFKVFMGPKAQEVLADAGYDLGRALDFGWFWFIAVPMLKALRLLHRISGNYGVDIILLTALVRVATIPLTRKSFRSMKEMQTLQPQLKRLQETYKDDQARLQKEMMELYKRHGVNPLSGCAPMLLQFPIFIGLYNALLHAIELRHAPFALWITDLSAPERLIVGGVGIPVLTVLMGGTMLVQQWLTPQQGDPTQRQMMMFMPIVFTFMFINFPAGLVLYWLVSNLLGIAQQYAMLRTPT